MPSVDLDVIRNEFPNMLAQFDSIVNRAIRKQIFVTEGDVKTNIVKYDAIDTGNMLGSVKAEMQGQDTGIVSVSAQSGDGYPYPVAVNFGTVYVSPRPFFTEAETKAETEFPGRMRSEFEAAF